MATTETAVQTEEFQHLQIAEIETNSGYRFWTKPMLAPEMKAYLNDLHRTEGLSDLCCSSECPCGYW